MPTWRNALALLALAAGSASAQEPRIFADSAPIAATLTVNLGLIRKDKGDKSPWRWATLSVDDSAGKPVAIPVKVRTRGIWRLKHCEIPPLRLDFSSGATKKTPFHRLDKPKLTSVCRNNDAYEQYILQEYQLYRVYETLTPLSPRVRLMRITYTDSASGKPFATRYAFLSEEPNATAARLGGKILEQQGAAPGELDGYHDAVMGVFQYMIGNTDFQISTLHNIELLMRPDSAVAPIAFDFDFSGAVNASYATADPRLRIKRVRDRQFRGYCESEANMARAIALFDAKRAEIYALYHDSLGALLSPRTVDETLSYFDDFYRTIDDPQGVKRAITNDCRSLTPQGTLTP